MPLDDEHIQARLGQVTAGNDPVVPGAYYNDIGAPWYFCLVEFPIFFHADTSI
jgi:hypothetical protein